MGYFSFQEVNNMSGFFFFKRPLLSTKWWTETIRISPWILDRDPEISNQVSQNLPFVSWYSPRWEGGHKCLYSCVLIPSQADRFSFY